MDTEEDKGSYTERQKGCSGRKWKIIEGRRMQTDATRENGK